MLPYPVISATDLAKIIHINDDSGDLPGFASYVVDGRCIRSRAAARPCSRLPLPRSRPRCRPRSATWGAADRAVRPRPRGRRGPARRTSTWRRSRRRCCSPWRGAPCHLIRERSRTRVGLIVESGDARAVLHHIALLIGYGGCQRLPVPGDSSRSRRHGPPAVRSTGSPAAEGPSANVIKALGKGLLKIMSKMGVSTVASYTGAQIFEGDRDRRSEVIGACFAPERRRASAGVGFDQLAAETVAAPARPGVPGARCRASATGGWRPGVNTSGGARASRTCSAPETVIKLQHATTRVERRAGDLRPVHQAGR